jgi:hypothetical protein
VTPKLLGLLYVFLSNADIVNSRRTRGTGSRAEGPKGTAMMLLEIILERTAVRRLIERDVNGKARLLPSKREEHL